MSYPKPKHNLQTLHVHKDYHQTKSNHKTSLLFHDRNLQNMIWTSHYNDHHEFTLTLVK